MKYESLLRLEGKTREGPGRITIVGYLDNSAQLIEVFLKMVIFLAFKGHAKEG